MMTSSELRQNLSRLALTEVEAAQLLSVSPRTVRRWIEAPAEIPGPAEQALRAWLRLESLRLPWRPDGIALGEDNPEKLSRQITEYRRHAMDLDTILQRVEDRGGLSAPWIVDLECRRATLGTLQISFYALANGGFSPSTYTRSDQPPDVKKDRSLIQDGFAAIALAIAKAGKDWSTQTSRLTKRGK